MKSITSLSGGKSSAYMAIHWPTDYTLFSCVLTDDPALAPKDPGVLRECQRRIPGFVGSTEVELTLLNLLKLEEMLGRGITWVCAYEGQNGASTISNNGWMPTPLSFDRLMDNRGALPNKMARWCTDELKVRAIYWHIYNYILETPDDLVWMHVGFRADEKHRWEKIRRCEANTIEHPVLCPIDAKNKIAKHRIKRPNAKSKASALWEGCPVSSGIREWRVPHCPMIDAGIDQIGDSCPDYEKLSPTTKRTTRTLPYQSPLTPDPWEVPESPLDRWAMVRRMVGAMHQVVEDLRQ